MEEIRSKIQTVRRLEKLVLTRPNKAREFVENIKKITSHHIRENQLSPNDEKDSFADTFSLSNEGYGIWLAMNVANQAAELCSEQNPSGKSISDVEIGGFIRTKKAKQRKTMPPDRQRALLYQDAMMQIKHLTTVLSKLYGHDRGAARGYLNMTAATFVYMFKKKVDPSVLDDLKKFNYRPGHPIEQFTATAIPHWLTHETSGEDEEPEPMHPRFSGTRLTIARIDKSPGVNPQELEKLVESKTVNPDINRLKLINSTRTRQGLPVVSEKQAKGLYLIPLRWAGKSLRNSDETSGIYHRDSDVWGRSDFQIGSPSLIIKGHGVPPHWVKSVQVPIEPAMNESALTKPVKMSVFHDPKSGEVLEQQFMGGMRQESVNHVASTVNLLQNIYQRALKEKDPVAMFAFNEGIRELPIPKHVASFQPLEAPGVVSKQKKRERVGNLGFLGNLKDKWRVWFYQNDHPHRLWEFQEPIRPINLTSVLRPAGITREGRTLTHEGNDISPEAATNIITRRHAVASALLVHLFSHRLKGSFSNKYGSVFSSLNTGPGTFYDFDTAGINTNTIERDSAYSNDVEMARNRIRETGRLIGLRLHAQKLPIGPNVALFNRLIKMGKTYAESRVG